MDQYTHLSVLIVHFVPTFYSGFGNYDVFLVCLVTCVLGRFCMSFGVSFGLYRHRAKICLTVFHRGLSRYVPNVNLSLNSGEKLIQFARSNYLVST